MMRKQASSRFELSGAGGFICICISSIRFLKRMKV